MDRELFSTNDIFMTRILASFVIVALFLVAPVAEALTVAELETKLAALLAQVDETRKALLKAQADEAATVAPKGNLCVALTRSLSLGSNDTETNGEVTKLQRALASDLALYPEASITGYFGPATERAVKRLQVRANIVSSGTPATTGYGAVGTATRMYLALCGQGSATPVSTPAKPTTTTKPTLTETLTSALPVITLDTLPASATSSVQISGTAKNLSSVSVTIRSTQVVYKNDSVPVISGKWSVATTPLGNGTYQLIVEGAGGGANAVGFIVVETVLPPTSTASSTPSSTSTALPAVTVVTPGVVNIFANGSDKGAAVSLGASAFISWSALNVTSCVLASSPTSEIAGTVLTSGSGKSGSLSKTTAFTLTCTQKDGAFVSDSLIVTVQ